MRSSTSPRAPSIHTPWLVTVSNCALTTGVSVLAPGTSNGSPPDGAPGPDGHAQRVRFFVPRTRFQRHRLPAELFVGFFDPVKQRDRAAPIIGGQRRQDPGVLGRARSDREHAEVFFAFRRYLDRLARPSLTVPVQDLLFDGFAGSFAHGNHERARFTTRFLQWCDHRGAIRAEQALAFDEQRRRGFGFFAFDRHVRRFDKAAAGLAHEQDLVFGSPDPVPTSTPKPVGVI